MEAVKMLERCLSLNGGYTAAYLVLATLSQGAKVGRLLRQVISLHPTSPDYLAYYADWLLAHSKLLIYILTYFNSLLTTYIILSTIKPYQIGISINKRKVLTIHCSVIDSFQVTFYI